MPFKTKQSKPIGYTHTTSHKQCSNCNYFELEHCTLFDYPVEENYTCDLWMPIFNYMVKAPKKYEGIDFKPTKGMIESAKRALRKRAEKPPSQRGMTSVGLARARDIIAGKNLSPQTWRRTLSYFQRHEVDKQGSTWDEYGKGRQAWDGWGGDPGFSRAKTIVNQMNRADNKKA